MDTIAINALSARGGGGETYIRNLFNHFPNKNDFKVYLFISHKILIPNLENEKKIKVIFIKDRGPIFRIIWENTLLHLYILIYKIDLVFFPGGTIPLFKIKQVKFITMFRNMIPFDNKELAKFPFSSSFIRNRLLSFLLKNSMKRADNVIFISKFGMRYINKITKHTIKNQILIYHGISKFNRIPEYEFRNFRKFENFILYPSMIHNYKNQIEVLKAYELFLEKNPVGPKLFFVGDGDHNYLNKLLDQIHRFKFKNKVKLFRNVPFNAMQIFYSKAKYIIFASMSENCPNILLEALSFGKAILCSRKYPMPEFGKKNVLYFNANSPNELSIKMDLLSNNKKILNSLEKKAKHHSKSFNIEKSTSKTWNYLLYNMNNSKN